MRSSDFELPILCWLDRNKAGTTHEIEIPNATRDEVYRVCDRLWKLGYLRARQLQSMDDDTCLSVEGLTESGRKRVSDAFKNPKKLRIDERHFVVRSILFQFSGPLDLAQAHQIDEQLTAAFKEREHSYRKHLTELLKSRHFDRDEMGRLQDFLQLIHVAIPSDYKTYLDDPDKWSAK